MHPNFDIEPVIVWQPIPGTSQEIALDSRCRHTLYSGSRGPGKSLDLNCLVLTDSGWKKAGEIQFSDKLVAIDGSFVDILGIFPQPSRQLYSVNFHDGSSVITDLAHRWKVKNQSRGVWLVRTTGQILNAKGRYSVPYLEGAVEGLRWQGLDPYWIGYMIANGTTKSSRLCAYTIDDEVLEYAESLGWYRWEGTQTAKRVICPVALEAEWRAVVPCQKGDQKHIPRELLWADPKTRLALLQGLMDGDGNVESGSKSRYSTVSEQLAKDICHLVKSLGGSASYQKRYRNSSFGSRGWIIRVNISHHNKFNPFRIKRKADRWVEQIKHLTLGIKSITPSHLGESVCFSVDHPEKCFIIENFIVTHNTDAQLMRFRRLVGLGYGSFCRGIIFDREYKALDDLVAKSKRWFPQFEDGARWKASKDTYKWVWPTGEELLFRQIKSADEYLKFHGHEYCLPEGEIVRTPSGPVRIETLKVGDLVSTLDGPKKVTKVYSVGHKPCIKASVYTLDGRLHSVQRQSESHRLLTIGGDWKAHTGQTSQIVPLFYETRDLQESSQTPFFCGHQDSLPISFQPEYVGIDAISFDKKLQRIQEALSSLLSPGRLEALLPNNPSMRTQVSKFCRGVLESFSLWQERKEGLEEGLLGHPQLRELFSQVLHHLTYYEGVLLEGGSFASHIALNFLSCCSLYLRLYDELVHTDRGTDRLLLPLQLCDGEQPLRTPSDDLSDEFFYNHPYQLEYLHPYVKDIRQSSNLRFVWIEVQFQTIGDLPCYDIEVESSNHYLSWNGLANKNCFIGWNELTKYPTSECYDIMMSVNRTSFRPEDHPKFVDRVIYETYGVEVPVDKDDPRALTLYLPELPLEVFSTTNPSGPGHSWVKKRFIDPAPYGVPYETTTRVFNPRTQQEEDIKTTQVTIFGSYRENIYLTPEYIAELLNDPDENRKKAWTTGSWDIVAGGALGDLWKPHIHILPRFVPPKGWRLDRSFDWGSTHPFSVGWWAVANGEEATIIYDGESYSFCPPPGTLVQIGEWYGAKELGDNKGLKLSAVDIADGILAREKMEVASGWYHSTPRGGPADNQIRDVRESDVETIENKMKVRGVGWTRSDKSPGSRVNGLQLIRDRLVASIKGEGPGLYFMEHCRASIATLPTLPRDTKNVDDVDTDAEDHAYDMVRYRVLAGAKELPTNTEFTFSL